MSRAVFTVCSAKIVVFTLLQLLRVLCIWMPLAGCRLVHFLPLHLLVCPQNPRRRFFGEHPEIQPQACASTSECAKKVKEAKDTSYAAIASLRAAALYGLKVLQECLNTEQVN